MIKAILVDDEPMAMKRVKKMLQSTGLVLMKNMYTAPQKALQNLRQDDPEMAFLDIEMIGMTGLMLAQ
ncbi:MAG: response regulator [Bacillota bacterium]|nr:response regulator [Bacillota bacterium]MDW7677314.1 response regulator [Bacillota bacterium]